MVKLDLVLWGATSFAGAIAAEYLAAQYGNDELLRIGLGGRDQAKLEKVREACARVNAAAKDWPILTGNSMKLEDMEAVVKRTRVIASTVGPFAQYGDALVEACAKHGVDYVDITGEVHWVRPMIDRFHKKAEETGALIVPCCGFDCIPSDLTSWLAENNIREMYGRGLGQAHTDALDLCSPHLCERVGGRSAVWAHADSMQREVDYIHGALGPMTGTVSGGTIASAVTLLDSGLQALKPLQDPYIISDTAAPAKRDKRQADVQFPRFSKPLGVWLTTFFLSPGNMRVVIRSQSLRKQQYPYVEGLRAKSVFFAFFVWLSSLAMVMLLLLSPVRRLITRLVPPGTGPSKDVREKGYFNVRAVGVAKPKGTEKPRTVTVTMTMKRDPGYGATSRMIIESALCLVKQRTEVLKFSGRRGGILTPSTCMGPILVERLQANADASFKVVQN